MARTRRFGWGSENLGAYQLLKRHAKSGGLRTFDALIAATAIESGFALVSKNRKYFQMIGELNLEVPDY